MTATVYNSKYQLTPDELDLQKKRGAYHRALTREITSSFVNESDPDQKFGIFLSGGVDSTTLLWTMLEIGLKPTVYTFHLPTTDHLSQDALKAKHLAERYDLPFVLVEFPDDPEWVARETENVYHEDPEIISSRADFEVLTLWSLMLERANADGITDLVSGISDGNIHLLSRKMEIRARQGNMGTNEQDFRRFLMATGDQSRALNDLCKRKGVNLITPYAIVANMMTYYKVPWQVMNLPRLKEITIGAWRQEEEDSGIKAIVSPMQCADSGSRVYFDNLIPQSDYVLSRMGRRATSGIVWYNFLKRERTGTHKTDKPGADMLWDWFNHVTEGKEIKKGSGILVPDIDHEKGRAFDPREKFADEEDDNLFGLDESPADEYELDENGEPDTRVDCLGREFYIGKDNMFGYCPRAQAGLCGKYVADPPYVFHKCEAWSDRSELSVKFIDSLGDLSSGHASKVYHLWASKTEEVLRKISEETFSFDDVPTVQMI